MWGWGFQIRIFSPVSPFPPTLCPFWGTLVRIEKERVRERKEENRTWGGIIKTPHQATQKTEPRKHKLRTDKQLAAWESKFQVFRRLR